MVPDTRSLLDYLLIVRDRYQVVLGTVGVLLCAALVVSLGTASVYVAEARVVLSVPLENDTRVLETGTHYTDRLVRSCTELATREATLGAAAARAGLAADPAGLVSARSKRDTTIIEVRAEGPTAARAARLADGVAAEMATVCDALAPGALADTADFAVSGVAAEPDFAVWPRRRLTVALAVLVGLLAGTALAIGLDRVAPRVGRSSQRIEQGTGLRALGRIRPGGGRGRNRPELLEARVRGLPLLAHAGRVDLIALGAAARRLPPDAVRPAVPGRQELALTGRAGRRSVRRPVALVVSPEVPVEELVAAERSALRRTDDVLGVVLLG